MLKNQLCILVAPLRGVEKCCSPCKEVQYLKGSVFFLSNNLTLDNALDVMVIAYQTDQNDLLDAAFKFVLKPTPQECRAELSCRQESHEGSVF